MSSSFYASYAEKELHVQNMGRKEFADVAEICEVFFTEM